MAKRPEQIVLVGLPGSGKSTVGPLLAHQLGWHFVDLDHEIQAHAGLEIREIFQQRGEAEFRRLERELTVRLASVPRLLLSAGGGWIVHNRLPNALVVWLRVEPGVANERVGETAIGRPLLQPRPLERLEELLAEREKFYELAHIQVDTNDRTPQEVAAAVAVEIDKRYGK